MRAVRALAVLLFLAACQEMPAPQGQCLPAPDFTAAPLNSCTGAQRVRLVFAGDVLLHRQLQRYAYAGGLPLVWQQAAPYIRWADIAVANLEGPVAPGMRDANRQGADPGPVFGTGIYTGYPQFNYHPMILPPLRVLGIDLVTTANNHAMDRGARGADLTLQQLELAGIAAVGTVPATGAREFVRRLPSRLGPIAFIACSFSTNGIRDPQHQVLRCFKDRETLLSLVRAAANDPATAAVIVLPHWGGGIQPAPRGPTAGACAGSGAGRCQCHHRHAPPRRATPDG